MGKKNILVIEDEKPIRDILECVLGERYNVILADTTDKGKEIIERRTDISLIFSDVSVPKYESGLKLMEDYLTRGPKQTVPVYMMSGAWSDEQEDKAKRMGVRDTIWKPFRPDEVIAIAEKHCQ